MKLFLFRGFINNNIIESFRLILSQGSSRQNQLIEIKPFRFKIILLRFRSLP